MLSPPRKPLSEAYEKEFEALTLEYLSPEARQSCRFSLASHLSRASARSSADSRASSTSGMGESLLRFR